MRPGPHDSPRLLVTALLVLVGLIAPPAQRAGAQVGRLPDYPLLDKAARSAIVDSVAMAIDAEYVFVETAKRMETLLRDRLRRGEYDKLQSLPELADELTRDLQSISHDKHLRVGLLPKDRPEATPTATPDEIQRRQEEDAARSNYGFESVQHLPGNIGYIDLRQFYDATVGGPTAVAAMNLVGHSDALIFDVRRNGGGDATMIQLIASYLFDQPTHLNSFWTRRDGSTRQYWSHSGISGPLLTHVPVYVLTSAYTFSAAEEFSYDLQNLKRGVIVGEVTGGGAHPVNRRVFPEQHVFVMVPFGRAVNPITNTNWEGVGVQPDIKCPADSALVVAQGEALRTLRARSRDPRAQQHYDWALSGLQARARNVVLEPAVLQAYAGVYGPRKVLFDGSALFYQRGPLPRMRMIPAGDDVFLVDAADSFRVRFSRAASGRVDSLVEMHDNGTSDETPRDAETSAGGG